MTWVLPFLGMLACRSEPPSPIVTLNRDDNGLWARRVWLYEPHTDTEIDALVANLQTRGITQLYPFLGPPALDGTPGWRGDDGVVHPVDIAVAAAFLERMHARAPDIKVLPWTGGKLGRDIDLDDPERLGRWIAAVSALPIDGVQLNVEPMPEQPQYRDMLKQWKAALGERTLSIAAYPPTTPLHPFADVHWSPAFLAEVCQDADDVAIMAYDSALTTPDAYRDLVTTWTVQAAALPPPEQGGCTVRIGVPDYEDDVGWHRPDAETLSAAIAGVRAGLATSNPSHVRGLAIYASWTTDAADWATYDKEWRDRDPVAADLIDVR